MSSHALKRPKLQNGGQVWQSCECIRDEGESGGSAGSPPSPRCGGAIIATALIILYIRAYLYMGVFVCVYMCNTHCVCSMQVFTGVLLNMWVCNAHSAYTTLPRLWANNNRQWSDYTTSPHLITPTTIYLLSTPSNFYESDAIQSSI